MKRCYTCKVNKDLSEFRWYTDREFGRVDECRDCMNTHQSNKEDYRYDLLISMKGGACHDCGLKGALRSSYTLHHRNPKSMVNEVRDMLEQPMDVLVKEISKCDLLCTICHMQRHRDIDEAAKAYRDKVQSQST